jgi:hypothetical protein
LKILFLPQFLHYDVLYGVVLICYSGQPVCSPLLRGSFIGNASRDDCFFFVSLPGVRWSLIAIAFLPAVSCEVTWFITEKAFKDFPCSVLLNRSSWYSSFPTSSYTLFISGSSGEEIFGFGDLRTRSTWGGIHCIWVMLGIPPLVIEWLPIICRWWPCLGFESIGPVPHMNVDSLLIDCCRSPLFVCCIWWHVADNVFVHCVW